MAVMWLLKIQNDVAITIPIQMGNLYALIHQFSSFNTHTVSDTLMLFCVQMLRESIDIF